MPCRDDSVEPIAAWWPRVRGPLAAAVLSGSGVIAGWSAVVLAPPSPQFDTFTALPALALTAGYLFQMSWALYVLPPAPLFIRLTLTSPPYRRWSWTLWVLPAVLPLLVIAAVTPWSLPTDSFLAGGSLAGVLALHLLLFALFEVVAVLAWALLIAPTGLALASFLARRPAGRSVFGALSTGVLRGSAALPLTVVGFGVSMASVSDEGRGRYSSMAHDLEEFLALTGEPAAIAATWVFIALVTVALVTLTRSVHLGAVRCRTCTGLGWPDA